MGKKAPKPPPAPDLSAAARQQGETNIETARAQARLSNPDIFTPWGSQTVTSLPGDRFRVDQSLSPQEQSLYESENAIKQALAGTSATQIGRIAQSFGQPMDPSLFGARGSLPTAHLGQWDVPAARGMVQSAAPGTLPIIQPTQARGITYSAAPDALPTSFGMGWIPGARQVSSDLPTARAATEGLPEADAAARQQAIDAIYGSQAAILDPRYKADEQRLYSDLANQGIQRGSEAFQTAEADFRRSRDLAYGQASRDAIIGGGQEQSRLFGLQGQRFGLSQQAAQQLFGQEAARYGLDQSEAARLFGQDASRYGLEQSEAARMFDEAASRYGLDEATKSRLFGESEATNARAYQQALQSNQDYFNQQAALYGLGEGTAGRLYGESADANARAFEQQAAAYGMSRDQANQLFAQQAQLYGLTQQNRQMALQEQEYMRNQALNELNALRTGSQVTMPAFQPFQGGSNLQAPDFLGAASGQAQYAQGLYNQQVAAQSAQTQGLYGLGGTLATAGAMFF